MPLTLTLTEGVLPKGQEKAAYRRLSEAMLKWHGLTGNDVMTANVVGSIHIVDAGAHVHWQGRDARRLHRVEGAVFRLHRPQGPGRLFRGSD